MKKLFAFALTILLGISSIDISASEIWRINNLADVLKGDAKGVSVSSDGTLRPAPAKSVILDGAERLAWSVATDVSGNTYVGTGGSGKLFVIDSRNNSRVLATLPEANVTAITIGRNNELFAATSPDGKIYRVQPNGDFSIHFEPGEKYIWALAMMPDGGLAVATGDGGRIYKVSRPGASRDASLLFDSPETNITTLAVGGNGNLYAGSDPNGLVIGITPNGRAFALLDSPLREIRDIAVVGETIFVLAVAEGIGEKGDAEQTVATASVQTVRASRADSTSKSRNDLSSSKSALYMIKNGGAHEILWSSDSISAFSILPVSESEILIGTSDKGRIYSVDREAKQSLLIQTDELQISRMIRRGDSIVGISGAGARALSIGPAVEKDAIYLSPILDARNVSTWGRLGWMHKGTVSVQVRTGNVEQPDGTWSDWRSVSETERKTALPNARFFQWQVKLGTAASISSVSVAFAQLNVAPEVINIQILPTNVALAPNVQLPTDPNIEASGMDPALFGLPGGAMPPRRLYQRGALGIQWTAEDRNGDRLLFDVSVRKTDESEFRTIRRDLTETFTTVDGLTLADGEYVFKVTAKDSAANPTGQGLTGSLTSSPISVDNSAPTVSQVGRIAADGVTASVRFEAKDLGGHIGRAEYSVNGGDWVAIVSDDGINDDSTEIFTVRFSTPSPGEYSVVLRVYDYVGNSGSARAVVVRP
jgi:hypothetical protein